MTTRRKLLSTALLFLVFKLGATVTYNSTSSGTQLGGIYIITHIKSPETLSIYKNHISIMISQTSIRDLMWTISPLPYTSPDNRVTCWFGDPVPE